MGLCWNGECKIRLKKKELGWFCVLTQDRCFLSGPSRVLPSLPPHSTSSFRLVRTVYTNESRLLEWAEMASLKPIRVPVKWSYQTSSLEYLCFHIMLLLIFYNSTVFYLKATRNVDVLCLRPDHTVMLKISITYISKETRKKKWIKYSDQILSFFLSAIPSVMEIGTLLLFFYPCAKQIIKTIVVNIYFAEQCN